MAARAGSDQPGPRPLISLMVPLRIGCFLIHQPRVYFREPFSVYQFISSSVDVIAAGAPKRADRGATVALSASLSVCLPAYLSVCLSAGWFSVDAAGGISFF